MLILVISTIKLKLIYEIKKVFYYNYNIINLISYIRKNEKNRKNLS